MKHYPKYSIRITYSNGLRTYLSHKNRMQWGKRTAHKHFKDVIEHSKQWVDGDKIVSIEFLEV